MKKKRSKFDKQFKLEVVKRSLEDTTVKELSEEFEIHPNVISRWRKKYLETDAEERLFPGNGNELLTDEQNDLLPDTADHQWTRKTLNDIVLHYLQSDTLRSGDDTDLLTIAEYCYSDGGAPVYDARALAWALLADVIYEDQCVQASQLPSMVKNVTSKLQTLSLAPNPAGDQVQISWDPDMDGKVRIEMLSVNGQLIRSIELKNAESFYLMNLFGVTPGSYLIRVTNGKRIQVGKLIIN